MGQLGNELASRSHAVKTSGAPKPIASMGSVTDPVVPHQVPAEEPAVSPMAMVLVILLSVSVLLNLLLLFTLLWK